MKPYMGIIQEWRILSCNKGPLDGQTHLGFVVSGRLEHRTIQTSAVVAYDEEKKTIETLNSRYDLGTPRTDLP